MNQEPVDSDKENIAQEKSEHTGNTKKEINMII